jgi:AcrR family transcriptional regulator
VEPIQSVGPVRVEPVQVRSSQRVVALLDATAAVVHEIGYETLTTAMVADRAGASIGTVYRYFPDRIGVLQALISRNRQRAEEKVFGALREHKPATMDQAVDTLVDALVELFNKEPGFRSLRLGDVLDIRPAHTFRTGNAEFAQSIGDEIADLLKVKLDSRARMALESAVEVLDALLGRAFLRVDRGDKAIIDEARRVAKLTLGDLHS